MGYGSPCHPEGSDHNTAPQKYRPISLGRTEPSAPAKTAQPKRTLWMNWINSKIIF